MAEESSNQFMDAGRRFADLVRALPYAEQTWLGEILSEPDRVAPNAHMALLNALPANIAVVDHCGVIVSVNKAWRLFASENGFSMPHDGIGQNYVTICQNADMAGGERSLEVAAALRAVLSGALREFSTEYPCHTPDSLRWYRVTITPIREERPVGAIVMHLNITERKLAELKVQRLNRLHGVCNGINDAIVRLRSINEVYEQACRLAVEQCGLALAWVGIIDGTALNPAAFWGQHEDYIENIRATALEEPHGNGPAGRAARTNAAARIHDVATDPDFGPWRDKALSHGFRSVAALPLKAAAKPVGAWVLYSTEPGYFGDEELQLLRSVAENVSFAVDSHQADQQRKRAEAALRASEANMAAAQRIAHFGSWEIDFTDEGIPDDAPLRWSVEMYRIAGLPPGSTVTRELFYSLIPAEERLSVRATAEKAIRKRTPYLIVHRLVRPDGETRLLREIAHLRVDEHTGRLQKMIGTAHDITEQRQAEQSIQLQAHMLDNIGQAVIATDVEGRVTYANRFAGELFGWVPAEMLGRAAAEITSSHDSREYSADVMRLLEQGQTWSAEVRMSRSDGAEFPAWVTQSPMRDEQGNFAGVIGISSDISERKKSEQRLAAFANLGRRLGGAATAKEAASIIVETADGLFGWDCCWFTLYDASRDLCRSVLTMDILEGKRQHVPPAYTNQPPPPLVRRAVSEGAQLLLRDEHFAGPTGLVMFGDKARRSASILIVPVRHGNAVIAVLSIQSYAHNAYRPDDLAAMEALADHCGGALAQIQAREALRESEARFTSLFRASPAAISINTVKEGRIIDVNDRYCEFVGYTREELMANTVIGLGLWLNPAHREAVMAELLRKGIVGPVETIYQRKSGERRDAVLSLELIDLAGETEPVLIALITDVTEQKRADQSIRVSDERFRLLSKATNDAIWDWDLAANTVWWNEGFETLFGYTHRETPTHDIWRERIHPDDQQWVLAELKRAFEAGAQQWSAEYRFRRKDGSYAFVLDRGYVICDSAGKPARMIGGMTDITQRKRSEQALAEHAALLDSAHEAILVKDLDDRVTYWNKGAERTYGWLATEILGRKVRDLLQQDHARVEEAWAALMRDGEWHGELVNRSKDGRELIADVRWTLVRDQHGNPKSVLAINSDITEKKRLEAQFLRAQRIESIGTLAGGIAHDLNNVLAPILMSIEMLKEEVKDANGLGLLTTLETSAQRGADLVKQVLSFARGVEGKRLLMNPGHIVRDIQDIVRDTFPKNIEFDFQRPSGLWAVTGDPTQLHQVLMNLCVNARDAMQTGGRLTVALKNVVLNEEFASMNPECKSGSHVCIAVTDTGSGVPPALRDRIFEPFFTTKEIGKGTGLGLSTASAIVRSHGGFLHLRSELGKGSAFEVYLPAAREAEIEPADGAASSLPRGDGELVLVVDDEAGIRHIAQRTLEKYGYRVLLARHGAEAVALYARHQHDIAVVLTDMAMPVMDGPALSVALRAINPEARVIGSSGFAETDALAKGKNAGVQHFIPKPYTAETMLTTLRQVLAEPSPSVKLSAAHGGR